MSNCAYLAYVMNFKNKSSCIFAFLEMSSVLELLALKHVLQNRVLYYILLPKIMYPVAIKFTVLLLFLC